MRPLAPTPTYFLLSVFDRQLWCSVIEARFEVADIDSLRALVGAVDNDDPELACTYYLDETEASALLAAFEINFDFSGLNIPDRAITVSRLHKIRTAPYLVHTGYELTLT
jgi:hypothetical protein